MGRKKKDGMSSDEKGEYSEFVAGLALAELKKDNLIKDYIKHEKYEAGKDYSVISNDNETHPLQIKSSYVGAYEHQMNYWRENIPAVVVNQYGVSKKNRKRKELKLVKKAKKDIIKIYKIRPQRAS